MIRGGHIIIASLAVLAGTLALKVALGRQTKDRPDEQSNSLRGCFPSRAADAACPLGGVGTHWFDDVARLTLLRSFEHVEDIEDDGFITLDRNAFGFPANHGRH
jgi:hypothetical protein